MDGLKITVEETFGEETKKMVLEVPFDGSVEEISDVFRTIMYFLTFVPGTVEDLICDNEVLAEKREERINEFTDSSSNDDCGSECSDCECCEACDESDEDDDLCYSGTVGAYRNRNN